MVLSYRLYSLLLKKYFFPAVVSYFLFSSKSSSLKLNSLLFCSRYFRLQVVVIGLILFYYELNLQRQNFIHYITKKKMNKKLKKSSKQEKDIEIRKNPFE